MITRTCLGCGQTDDHPKDLVSLRDGSEVAWHMDCHATTGCEACTQQTKSQGAARGDEFRTILTREA